MKTRRGFFEMVLSAGLIARFVPGTWLSTSGSAGFHLVNGWILTDRDIEEIRKHKV